MRVQLLKLSSFLLFLIGQTVILAQQAQVTSGGNSSGSGGTVSYSIGQITYKSIRVDSGSVTQGVQQPYEISVVSALKEAKYISLNCRVYPNPVTDYLILKIESEQPSNYVAYLYDINGKLLSNIIIEANETTIDMSHFVASTYLLKVSDSKKEVKTFKIIKH